MKSRESESTTELQQERDKVLGSGEKEKEVLNRIARYIETVEPEEFLKRIREYPLDLISLVITSDAESRHYQGIISVIIEMTGEPNERRKFLESLQRNKDAILKDGGEDIDKTQMFKGISFLDIGGGYSRIINFLTNQGAEESVNCDPNLSEVNNYWYKKDFEEKNIYVVPRAVTIENYQDIFKGKKFDVTFSSELFERGSGLLSREEEEGGFPEETIYYGLSDEEYEKEKQRRIEDIKKRRGWGEADRYQRLLDRDRTAELRRRQRFEDMGAVFVGLTKAGGIIIHEGKQVPRDRAFLEKNGLELVYKLSREEIGTVDPIYVFRKIDLSGV